MFKTIKGAPERLLKSGQSAPSLDTAGVRIALDVHRDARSGDVLVQYGSGATTVGTGLQAVNVKVGKAPLPPTAGATGALTLTLTFQVVLDPGGKVSLITPGGDPGNG